MVELSSRYYGEFKYLLSTLWMCDTLRTVRTKIARLLPLSTDSLLGKANLFMANYEEEKYLC